MNERKENINDKQLVLLGLIAEEPIHAYGLEDKISSRYMNEWTEIGFSSIYRVLGQLEERGFIDSHLEHEGQGATRKVYTINEQGREVLSEAVLDHLGTVHPIKNPFQIGLVFLVHAPRARVIEQLEKRTLGLIHWREELDRMKDGCTQEPVNKLLVIDHAVRHLKTEQEFLENALSIISASEEPQ